MHNFSRITIVRALDLLGSLYGYHNQVDKFCLLYELEDVAPKDVGAILSRILRITEHLIRNPDLKGPEGGSLIFEIIEHIISVAQEQYNYSHDNKYIALENSLRRDGYIIEDGKLKSSLPDIAQLSEKENELFSLLEKYNFSTEKGHLDQAIKAHTRGDWAAANAQLRSFMEGLFDSIAEKLAPKQEILPQHAHSRRIWLSQNPSPSFFQSDLNEWQNDGKGFVQGLFKRLHPQGSHPGLSDEEDSTFRLHLVILTGLHYLRRFSGMV